MQGGEITADVTILSEEDLITKHRKEKKELQAKITKLKHSVSKGEKKKKKEVTAEIATLEAELQNRHDIEIKQFHEQASSDKVSELTEKVESLTTEDSSEVNTTEKGKKVSKAQKRRDKKAQESRDRDERIKQADIENLLGDRNIEEEKLKSILSKRSLAVEEVPSDGNCLYSAVVNQLAKLDVQSSMESLRQQTACHMRENMDDFFPFLTKPETGDPYSPEEYEKYCHDVESTPAWGGQLEIRALSTVLKKPIEVVQADGPSLVTGEEYSKPAIILSYHRHKYGLGEHYNSVVPKVEEDDEGFS